MNDLFTGIVEETGKIKSINKGDKAVVLKIGCKEVLSDAKLGDSISVNGICLTVTNLDNGNFSADVMPETMKATSLSELSVGSAVNLERAVQPTGRLGGHIVSGHVDGTGTIKNTFREGNAVIIKIAASNEILKYIIKKGSIAVDGISLTVQDLTREDFTVSIIPHTMKNTVLPNKKSGDKVNLENDVLGKYVEKLLFEREKSSSNMTFEYLIENGF